MGDIHRLNLIASRQHGVFSLSEARDAGFGRTSTHRHVAAGHWIRLDHSVFALASSPATWERQTMAAVRSRPEAVVGNRSAAYLLGLAGFGKGRPVIVVPKGSNPRSSVARVIESDQFDTLATTIVNDFRVTTTPETLLSLAADISSERIESAFDDALLSGRLDLDSMKAILDREAGRRPRGIRTLRELTKSRLPSAPMKDSSYLEALLERLLSKADVPSWVREYPFALLNRQARVDVYIPQWSLVIEADGRNWHLRRADFENDRRRDNELARHGIQVLRYTHRMLTAEADRCRDEIVTVGSLRSAQRSA